MSKRLFNRTRPLQRFACALPFAASLAAVGSCSDESTKPQTRAPAAAPEGLSESAEARSRIQAIRSRFPDAIGDVAIDRFEAGRDGAIRPVLSSADSSELPKKVATVELPRDAAGPVRVTDEASRFSASFHLDGAANTSAQMVDGIVLYPEALPGADVLHRVRADGTEDFVYFAGEPARKELRYQLDMAGIAGLRLVSNTLEMLDRGGAPRVRVAPPYVLDSTGRRHEARIEVEGCAVDTSPRGPWGRPVTEPGAGTCAVKVSFQQVPAVYPALVDPFWASTTNPMQPRTRHTMTLLDPFNGSSRVLLAGGFNNGAAVSSAEFYEPLSRTFAMAAPMTAARGAHTAALLTTIMDTAGESPVLIAGGSGTAGGIPLGSLEVFDPVDEVFVQDPNVMTNPRFNHTATLFKDNEVLLAGGISLPLNQPTNSAARYVFTSVVAGTVTSALTDTPAMAASRTGHTASRLRNGNVLIAGGFVVAGTALQSGEIFDGMAFVPVQPTAGLSSVMTAPRGLHSATVLASEEVLLAGGVNKTTGGVFSNSAEIFRYDPPNQQGFQALAQPMTGARANHTATLLSTGKVLIAGGFNGLSALTSVEVFTPQPAGFAPLVLSPTVPLIARGDHAALLVHAGNPDVGELSEQGGRTVLVTGGSSSSAVNALGLSSAQILLRLNGDACGQGLECVSGFCSDNVCCDQACDEICYACSAAAKEPGNGSDGVCGPASKGSEILVQCINEVETHSQCNGAGTWELNAETIVCTPGFCGGDGYCATVCDEITKFCSPAGWCDYTVGSGAGGGGGAAGGGAGGGGQGGGPPGTVGSCKPKRPNSATCYGNDQCISDNCVDGLCCDLPCDGQCQACDIPGFPGKCLPVGSMDMHADPHPNANGTSPRAACNGVVNGMSTGCSGFCVGDPTTALVCTYPDTMSELHVPVCVDADSGPSTITHYPCDHNGGFTEMPADCVGHRCESPSSCKTSCTVDTDCVTDFICLPGAGSTMTCQPLTGPLCDGKFTLRRPSADGGDLVCPDHYTCPEGSTQCRTDCDSADDCVDDGGTDYVCSSERKCVPQLTAGELASCGCRWADRRSEGFSWGIALGAMAIGALRRRRRALKAEDSRR